MPRLIGAVLAGLVLLVAASAAALWILRAPDIPRAVLEARYAAPPSKFLQLDPGTRVHYRERGPRGAPVLVLLHGFSGSLFGFEAWSRDLSRDHRVISLDLPGSGLTGAVASGDYSQAAMADFVKAFADRKGLGRFALAGNSMGGGIAARFAERFPQRVSALILLDAPGAPTGSSPRWNLRYYLACTPLAREVLVLNPPGELNRMEGTREAMLAHYRLRDDDTVWTHLRAIEAPVLILWGRNDRTIPLASAYVWAGAIAGAALKIYPHAGHTPMIEAAKPSAADVRAFLAKHR